jgi:hypothetical protein
VLLEDTWGRPVLVLDESSTAGKMLLTASGAVHWLRITAATPVSMCSGSGRGASWRAPLILRVRRTNPRRPIQLAARHCGWHRHGAFTSLPAGASTIQRNARGESITWQLDYGTGQLLVSTKDPIVEHGVQQIRHLDSFNDALTQWLCQQRPSGPFTVERRWYAVRNFRPAAPIAAEPLPSL